MLGVVFEDRQRAIEMAEHRFTNRLAKEKSPYLLQHAHNPVDWFPWGEEAFATARAQDKPIFLSIGYATCHWCHVMERESFENVEIAKIMNDTFVCIKVDREELPELDSLYMEFAQSMMAGAAGWPLNVILTPSLEPFFSATYLPPQSKHGLIGLTELIVRIREIWKSEEREKVLMQASKIVDVFAENIHSQGDEIPNKQSIEDAAELLFQMADPVYGGIKGTPKFPIGYQINFLLSYSYKAKESRALFLAERTLDMIHRGGIYDHLGGGFSRYTIDEKWQIPHFEKMLYDNALLAMSYLAAWQITKKPLYRQVCEEILHYILRDMTHPEGGFYSAQDSESEGYEGRFYLWTMEEIELILGPADSDLFCEFYDVSDEGNFENSNILNTPLTLQEFSEKIGIDIHELKERFAIQKQLLWKTRETRPHPLKDDKILTSWNGLMIHALASAGKAFEDSRYIAAAQRAAFFIKKNLWKNNKLLHRWREGEALYDAGLDDYAFLLQGIITLFEAGGDPQWLHWALELAEIIKDQFKAEEGAFYQTDGQTSHLILRKCQFSDGAEPSGNAIHTENLLRLYQLTFDDKYLKQAEDVLKAVKKYFDSYSPGYVYHIMNLLRYYDQQALTFVVALNQEEDLKEEIFHLLNEHFIAHKAVIWRKENDNRLFELLPNIAQQKPIELQTTLYICREGVCERPLTNLDDIENSLRKLS